MEYKNIFVTISMPAIALAQLSLPVIRKEIRKTRKEKLFLNLKKFLAMEFGKMWV